jgi:hypothetical protein
MVEVGGAEESGGCVEESGGWLVGPVVGVPEVGGGPVEGDPGDPEPPPPGW